MKNKKLLKNISNLDFYDFHPQFFDLKKEILSGLSAYPKRLPAKLFYDYRGSELFEQILELEEYYIPKAEYELINEIICENTDILGNDVFLIEPGSGNGKKARKIFESHKNIKGYMPIEISKEFLLDVSILMAKEYPEINFFPVCADYLSNIKLPEKIRDIKNKVVFFPGSSIGNYNPEEAKEILKKFIEFVDYNGGLLIGVDLKKNKQTIELAYNDLKGVTAEFNLNVLQRIKKELETDLAIENFYHQAFYNETEGRIEMHLVSKKEHEVNIENSNFYFKEDETIHTENSYKYTIEEFKNIGFSAGYKEHSYWKDKNDYFSLHYFKI